MMKLIAIALLLCLSGCKTIEDPPEHMKCGYSWRFQKFRCCLNNPKENKILGAFVGVKSGQAPTNCADVKLDNPIMEGAQALPINDTYQSYQVMEDYTRYLQAEAKKSCK